MDSRYREGDHAAAVELSEKAKKWWIGALIAGLAVGVLYLIFVVGLFSSAVSPSVEP